MQLSLAQAAQLLGKSPRQVRYLIRTRRLAAKKEGGRWIIERDDLPLTAAQRRALERKRNELADVVETALGPRLETGKRRYSVREMAAFQKGREAYRACRDALGADHCSTSALESSLVSVSRGCHRFLDGQKVDAYRDAREEAARAVALALLSEDEKADAVADLIEHELLPAVAGLIRRSEGRKRR